MLAKRNGEKDVKLRKYELEEKDRQDKVGIGKFLVNVS